MTPAHCPEEDVKEALLQEIQHGADFMGSRAEAKRLAGLLGRFWSCSETMPGEERRALLSYAELFTGPSVTGGEPRTYAEVARRVMGLLKEVIEEGASDG